MSDFIQFLKTRIDEAKRELQSATDRMNKAEAERAMLSAELQGYERTLAAENRRQGQAVSISVVAGDSTQVSDSFNGETVSKAEFARQFIRSRADSGSTPNDIYQGFQAAGIAIKKPYVYALVQRLQKQTAIRPRRGKWYPVPESERVHAPNGSGG